MIYNLKTSIDKPDGKDLRFVPTILEPGFPIKPVQRKKPARQGMDKRHMYGNWAVLSSHSIMTWTIRQGKEPTEFTKDSSVLEEFHSN
jgi:hypothetical protein